MTYALHHTSYNGKLFSGLDKAKKQRPKICQGILRCRPKNSETVALRSGAHEGLMCPLEKGVRGIKTNARSVWVWDRVPIKKRESSDERLKTLPKNGSFLLSHLVWQYHRR